MPLASHLQSDKECPNTEDMGPHWDGGWYHMLLHRSMFGTLVCGDFWDFTQPVAKWVATMSLLGPSCMCVGAWVLG